MSYFDKMSESWTRRYKAGGHFSKRMETALAWLDTAPGQRLRLLDFGCGSGVLMSELLARGHEVLGTDSSPGMLAQARRELEEFAPVPLELIERDDYGGDYLGHTYQGVFCLGVLEYVDRPELLLERLASVVEPGGFLILSAPNRRSLLRQVEGFVHRHGRWFRAVPKLRHLTCEESYLKFQKHQFKARQLDEIVGRQGLRRQALTYHVAPRALGSLDGRPTVGMTLITKYQSDPAGAGPRGKVP